MSLTTCRWWTVTYLFTLLLLEFEHLEIVVEDINVFSSVFVVVGLVLWSTGRYHPSRGHLGNNGFIVMATRLYYGAIVGLRLLLLLLKGGAWVVSACVGDVWVSSTG